jgi:hypothetical protein
MKWLVVLLLAVFIGAGCAQAEVPPTAPPPTEVQPTEIVATAPPATELPAVAEVETAIEPEHTVPAEITAEPTAVPPTATAEPEAAGQQESTTDEVVAINGVYENSYFRGSADAPVTLIDYSDFL